MTRRDGQNWVMFVALLAGCGGVEHGATGGAGSGADSSAGGDSGVGGDAVSGTGGASGGSGGAGRTASSSSSSSTAGTSSGSGGTGGDAGASCEMCVEVKDVFKEGTPCGDTLAACTSEAPCLAWLQCSADCFDSPSAKSCLAACTQAHPGAAPHLLPLYDCVCTACATECGAACM